MDTYEKKYKEALEIAQKLYQDCPNGKNDRIYHTTDLEKMFPELKESEDEKVRKEIISFIQDDIDEINLKVSGDYDDRDEDDIAHQNWCKKAIAWLENIPYTIDHEKREGFHLGYKAALEKQGEQKPAEWSEKDESLRLRTIGALETCKIGSPTKCVDEQINWLKSLKQRIGG